MTHTAFIGVGNMGGPMAGNLAKSGREVKVFNLTPAAMQAAAEGGGVLCFSSIMKLFNKGVA